jgi:hypothetical protein
MGNSATLMAQIITQNPSSCNPHSPMGDHTCPTFLLPFILYRWTESVILRDPQSVPRWHNRCANLARREENASMFDADTAVETQDFGSKPT